MGDDYQQVQHFSHHHPLIFKAELDHTQNDIIGHPPVFCDGCEEQVLGPSYSCRQCPNKFFILHKSCAELSHEIRHPIHRKHPLVLTSVTEGLRGESKIQCDACKQDCKGSFMYNCSQCDFNLDLKCASDWRNIMDSSHDHIFTVLRKPRKDLLAYCDVCGVEDQNDVDGTIAVSLYLCSICQLRVHKECCWLPSHVNIASHPHPLKLTWCFEDIYPKGDLHLCQICFSSMEKSRAVYYCYEACCSFVAHNRCAIHLFVLTLRPKPPEKTAVEDADADVGEPRQHINEQMQQLEEELPKTINHFSHRHILTLMNIMSDNHDDTAITCNGCMRPITVTDVCFYSCTSQDKDQEEGDCHFFLHKNCSRLPSHIDTADKNFLRGTDRLTLIPRVSLGEYVDDGVFVCGMCKNFSQGFAYFSTQNLWTSFLDIVCAGCASFLQTNIRHKGHASHQLFLANLIGGVCNGCGTETLDDIIICCAQCSWFHLCMRCVKLPLTARHRYDTHPLKLTYQTTGDDEDEYYCEICEGKRDPTHWYYSCADCDFQCHPHCILGMYPQVKLGSAHKLAIHPPHPMTLVEKRKSPIPNDKRQNSVPCECNRKPCLGLVFDCSICNINIHRACSLPIPQTWQNRAFATRQRSQRLGSYTRIIYRD